MDVIALRRKVISQKWNYLAVKWAYYKYINSSGEISESQSDRSASSYTENIMLLKAGTYNIHGFNSYTGTNGINYRIHEYDANGKWIKQIGAVSVPNNSAVDFTFILDHDAYIRISLAILYFTGTLTKVS